MEMSVATSWGSSAPSSGGGGNSYRGSSTASRSVASGPSFEVLNPGVFASLRVFMKKVSFFYKPCFRYILR